MTVLGARALNRATLARQHLDARVARPAIAEIEHLVGMQAQEPLEPYVGLWSRLTGFDPAELVGLMERREVVRTHLQRRTIHLLTSADCLALRSLFQPMLVSRMWHTLGRVLPGVDLDELAAAGRPHFHASPLRLPDAARLVAERWPEAKVRDLGDALASLVELVQVPPRGVWGNPDGACRVHHDRGVPGQGTRSRTGRRRRAGAALPARVRPCGERGRPVVVGPDRAAGGDQGRSPAAAHLP